MCHSASAHPQPSSPSWIFSVLYHCSVSWEFVCAARTAQGDNKDSTELTVSCEPRAGTFHCIPYARTEVVSRITQHYWPGVPRNNKSKPKVFQNTRWYPNTRAKGQAGDSKSKTKQALLCFTHVFTGWTPLAKGGLLFPFWEAGTINYLVFLKVRKYSFLFILSYILSNDFNFPSLFFPTSLFLSSSLHQIHPPSISPQKRTGLPVGSWHQPNMA